MTSLRSPYREPAKKESPIPMSTSGFWKGLMRVGLPTVLACTGIKGCLYLAKAIDTTPATSAATSIVLVVFLICSLFATFLLPILTFVYLGQRNERQELVP